MRDAIGAATRSNVAYYTIDPRGLVGDVRRRDGHAGAAAGRHARTQPVEHPRRAAARADEPAVARRGDRRRVRRSTATTSRKIYDRVVRDSSNYYLLGYYPTDDRRDGRVRRIQVKVNRPDVKVFARKAYLAPEGQGREEADRGVGRRDVGRSARRAELGAADAGAGPLGARGAVQGRQQDGVGDGDRAGRRRPAGARRNPATPSPTSSRSR